MPGQCSTACRVFVLALLVLTVSPVTAPFSTCDLFQLLGGTTVPAATAAKPKPSADHHDDGLLTPTGLAAALCTDAAPPPAQSVGGNARRALHRPLRI